MMSNLTLEDIFNDYKKIIEAHAKNELSKVHMQGALAYLELKAKDSDMVFVAPELNRDSPNYTTPPNSPKREDLEGLANDEASEDDDYVEEVSSELFGDSDSESVVTIPADVSVPESSSEG
jgi:hypothetical protein